MILVTGAAGTTGREVVRQLTAAGQHVRALVRDPRKAPGVAAPGVQAVIADLEKPETLATAVRGVSKVFLVTTVHPKTAEIHGNLIDAARQAGVRHIVRLSALGAGPDTPLALGKWHYAAEKRLTDSGVPFTHLQPPFFMQNMLGFAGTITAQGAFYLPMKDARISLVDTRDIAAVGVAALLGSGHEGKTYEITGPEALSCSEMAEKLSAATGRKISYVDVPSAQAKQGMLGTGYPEWLADGLVELFAWYSEGRGAAVSPVVGNVTGKKARTFDQFAAEFAPVFRGEA